MPADSVRRSSAASGPTWKWIVGVLLSVILGGGSIFATHISAQQDAMSDRQDRMEHAAADQAQKMGERMMRVETKVEGIEQRTIDINSKLDRLLEGQLRERPPH